MQTSSSNKDLLRKGNSELSELGIFVWSIPALVAKSNEFGLIKTCPNAGICAALCYARTGRYRFGNVINAHTKNLEEYLRNPTKWKERLLQELSKKKFKETGKPHELTWKTRSDFAWWVSSGCKAVRIHDAGDFFSYQYLVDWSEIAKNNPRILFYTYTKQVSQMKRAEKNGLIPNNFVFIYSMGGKEDDLIETENDRHDDIFPDVESLEKAGYEDQEKSDLMAALLPTNKIGIVANRIPKLVKLQGSKTFSNAQKEGLGSRLSKDNAAHRKITSQTN